MLTIFVTFYQQLWINVNNSDPIWVAQLFLSWKERIALVVYGCMISRKANADKLMPLNQLKTCNALFWNNKWSFKFLYLQFKNNKYFVYTVTVEVCLGALK